MCYIYHLQLQNRLSIAGYVIRIFFQIVIERRLRDVHQLTNVLDAMLVVMVELGP